MFLINILMVLTVLVFCIYLYLTRHFNYWKKQGIHYIKPLPLFGNLKDVFLQKQYMGSVLQQIYDQHKRLPYVGIYAIDKPALVINDLDLVRNIMIKDSQYFLDHNMTMNEKADPLWANLLFVLKGDNWKNTRHKLSHTFSSGKIKLMFYLVNNCSKNLTTVLDNTSADGAPVPVKETLARYTTDAISTCTLGIEANSLNNPSSDVRHYMSKVVDFTIRKGILSFLMYFEPEISTFLKMKFLDDETSNFFRNAVWETVKYREKNGVVRKDLLDSLMELRKQEQEGGGGGKNKIDGDMFVAQALGIFLGGFETTSSAITFMLYELAKHPEIQSTLRKEICEVLKKYNNEVTYDAIQEMKYLDMVISESLRKYPVLGIIDRVCGRDYDLPGPSGKGVFTVKAGTSVYIPLIGIHYNPEYYPDPDKFDPERFTEENKLKRHSFSYFPFGDGPRVCIGKRFGLMQMKTSMAHMLPKFEVSTCKQTPQYLVYDSKSFIVKTEEEMYLNFKKIGV